MVLVYGMTSSDIQKTFAISRPNLNHETYITEIESISCLFQGLRGVWSALLDYFSYKKVYGVLLVMQVILGLTFYSSAKSIYTYALWVWLSSWLESGQYMLVPNILKIIYGKHATVMYGVLYTYTGFSSTVVLILLRTSLATQYLYLGGCTGLLSCISLVMLFTIFN